MDSSIFKQLAFDIRFNKQEAHIDAFKHHMQQRIIEACTNDDSHVKILSQ